MNYVDSFYNFAANDGSINFDELFTFNENGSSARYSKEEFKDLFRDSLMESDGYADEEILENAHSYYELGMLYEAKSHWFESNSNFNYLDCESHVILIKDGEGYMIEKSTFDKSRIINEGFWDDPLGSIKSGWQKVKSVAKSAVKKTASVIKDGWDKLSYGAKKAWEFVKTCGSVIVQFVKGMTFIEWAALAMSVLSAILGICGAIAAGSVVFSWLSPILNTIGGICQAVAGGIHIYEGQHKISNANKILAKDPTISPTAKMAAKITQGLPEYITGLAMIALGVYDITKSATSPVDPSSGTQSVAVGTSVKSTLIGVGKTIAKPGGAIHHFIEHAGVAMMKKVGVKVASEAGKAAVGKIFTAVVSTVSSSIMSSVFGWLWSFVLKAGQAITKGFEYLIKIPSEISGAIDKFKKEANNTFTKIIAKGLDKLVKPMTDASSRAISKYIQPIVDKVKSFLEKEIKSYKEAEALVKEYKHELHTGIKHHEHKKPSPKKAENPLEPKHKIDDKKVTKKDQKIIKKATNKAKGKKVKESQIWENRYIQSFDDLNFV